MTWDSVDGYVLLFGGANPYTIPTSYFNDTWTYLAGHWTNRTGGRAPSERFGFGLADDPTDHEVVLFGGLEAHTNRILNDTWTYSAGVWTNVTSQIVGHSPPAVYWGAMTFDNQTGSVILFGGARGDTPETDYTNQTWSFHDNVWTNLTSTISPPARNSESLVFDAGDDALLMFGGQNESYLNDTWTYSGGVWTQITTVGAPDVRLGAGIAYDAALSEVVLFGGYPANFYPLDTFTYHAGTWTRDDLVPGPYQSTVDGQMAYDYADNCVLLYEEQFGGNYGYTWVLNTTSGPAPPPLSVTAAPSPMSGLAPLLVTLTSEISGGSPPYTLTWNFDDGTQAVTGNPATAGNTTHTYETAGKYNLSLKVVDSASATVSKNWTITVTLTELTLSIAASPTTAKVNQTVTFTATPAGGAPPYTYVWTFGDGGTSAIEDPTHAYSKVGTYTAQLVLHDSVGNSVIKMVTVTVSTTGSSSTNTSSDWWIYAIVAVVVIVALVIFVVVRRRKPQPPSGPSSMKDPPGPPRSGSG